MTVITSSEIPKHEQATLSDRIRGAVQTTLQVVTGALISGRFIVSGLFPKLPEGIVRSNDDDVCHKSD